MSDLRVREVERLGRVDPGDPAVAARLRAERARRGDVPDFRSFLVEMPDYRGYSLGIRARYFFCIRFGSGDVMLSVQASGFHYSIPRATLTDLSEYTHWELGDPLPGCPFEEHSSVADSVSTEVVQRIFTWAFVTFGEPSGGAHRWRNHEV